MLRFRLAVTDRHQRFNQPFLLSPVKQMDFFLSWSKLYSSESWNHSHTYLRGHKVTTRWFGKIFSLFFTILNRFLLRIRLFFLFLMFVGWKFMLLVGVLVFLLYLCVCVFRCCCFSYSLYERATWSLMFVTCVCVRVCLFMCGCVFVLVILVVLTIAKQAWSLKRDFLLLVLD